MTSNLRVAGIAVLLALLGQQKLVSSVQIGEEGTPYPGFHHRAAIQGRKQRGIDDEIPPVDDDEIGEGDEAPAPPPPPPPRDTPSWKDRMMGFAKARLGVDPPKPKPPTDDVEPEQLGWRARAAAAAAAAKGGMSAMGARAKAFGQTVAENKHVVNGRDAVRKGLNRALDAPVKAVMGPAVRGGISVYRGVNKQVVRGRDALRNRFGAKEDVIPDVQEVPYKPLKKITKSAEEPMPLATNGTNTTNGMKGKGKGKGSGGGGSGSSAMDRMMGEAEAEAETEFEPAEAEPEFEPAEADIKDEPAEAEPKDEPEEAVAAAGLVEHHKPKTVRKKTTKSAEEPKALTTNGTNATNATA